MSTETIVNRVNQGPFLEAEAAKLAKIGPAPVFEIIGQDPGFDPLVEQAAEERDLAALQQIQASEPEQLPSPPALGDIAPIESIGSVESVLVSVAVRMQQDYQRQQEFKATVISAFKHLGLDTRKFFGE